jgi:hypothetical protein
VGLSIPQMALMGRLLDEALPLDEASRRRWLEKISPDHRDLVDALRRALFPDAEEAAALAAWPKYGWPGAPTAPSGARWP